MTVTRVKKRKRKEVIWLRTPSSKKAQDEKSTKAPCSLKDKMHYEVSDSYYLPADDNNTESIGINLSNNMVQRLRLSTLKVLVRKSPGIYEHHNKLSVLCLEYRIVLISF